MDILGKADVGCQHGLEVLFNRLYLQHIRYLTDSYSKTSILGKFLEAPEVIDLTVDVMPGCKVEVLEVVVKEE